jgi:hypothetical protein
MRKKIRSYLSSQIVWNVAISILCLTGIGVVIYSTVWGAVLSDDSYHYISSARNLLAGEGFTLTPHFTPLLPLLLSAIGVFRIDPLISVRWVNAFLFALNIYLTARVIYCLSKSRIFSWLGALFTLISSTLIMIHSSAMSEALFITLTLISLWIFSRGYQKDDWNIPLYTGIFFGLATVTRYIGISLLLAGGLYWLFEKGKMLRTRIRNAFLFSSVGIFPLLLWIARNELIIGRPTSRMFAVHLLPSSGWISILNTVLLWVIPGRFIHGKEILWLMGIIIVSVVFLSVRSLSRHKYSALSRGVEDYSKPAIFILLCMLAYLVVLIVARSFFDDRIPMDERLLSPLLVIGLIFVMWIFTREYKPNQWISISLIILISSVMTVTNLTRSIQMVQSYHEVGRGYSSARDHFSETYAYLRNRPDVPVYSNAYAAIYFWTGRVTYPIPSSSGVAAMKENMKKTGALLVIFDSIRVELYGTTVEELTQGLVVEIRLSEATIYRAP